MQNDKQQEELFPTLVPNEEPAGEAYPSLFPAKPADAPMLTEIEIDGLKGFDKCKVFLSPLTLLTGPNNSGKSTILQAIALGHECFRRCLDTTKWTLRKAGRSVREFEFLPVNEPKDLWFRKIWKPSIQGERYVRVNIRFSNGFAFSSWLRFLYGGINLGVEVLEGAADEKTLKDISAIAPVLLPASPGPSAHEDYYPLAQIHRLLGLREPSRVIRNVLLRLAQEAKGGGQGIEFLNFVLERYFQSSHLPIEFDETRDVELRGVIKPSNDDYSLDLVSAGSGLNQILSLTAVLAWRRPGIVLLDEPDAHLHSSIQAQLLEFLSDLATRFNIQIVAATHSRDIISRAALKNIVPVDRSRTELHPLESLEHLLLEYERHGVVSNVDLALLYQTRRCVFVEGPSDVKLLPRIAERLGYDLFVGANQFVAFDIEGVGKIGLVPQLVRLFERLIGAKLNWAVIRDSDANVPAVKSEIEKQAAALGIPLFHLWSRYSIENYLLEIPLIVKAIKSGVPKTEVDDATVRSLLTKALAQLENDVDATYVRMAQVAYRDLMRDENWPHNGAAAGVEYAKSLKTLEDRIRGYPGRRAFGKFVLLLQESHGIQLRIDDLVTALDKKNAPAELSECFERLKNL